MEQIIRTDQEGCDLLPEASLEERKPDDPVADVRPLREPVRIIRHQDLVPVLMVYTAERFDQPSAVTTQPDVEAFEMPRRNYSIQYELSRALVKSADAHTER